MQVRENTTPTDLGAKCDRGYFDVERTVTAVEGNWDRSRREGSGRGRQISRQATGAKLTQNRPLSTAGASIRDISWISNWRRRCCRSFSRSMVVEDSKKRLACDAMVPREDVWGFSRQLAGARAERGRPSDQYGRVRPEEQEKGRAKGSKEAKCRTQWQAAGFSPAN